MKFGSIVCLLSLVSSLAWTGELHDYLSPEQRARVEKLKVDVGQLPTDARNRVRFEGPGETATTPEILHVRSSSSPGPQPGTGSLLGVPLNVDLNGSVLVIARADANGRVSAPAPIPDDSRLAQAKLYMQIIAVDPAGPQGFSSSRGMWVGICPK